MSLLRTQGLAKRFGGVTAVSSVDVEIETAQILGIIGPNGAGKTTLFNIISGLEMPDAGSVHFDGVDTTGWPLIRIARSGLVRTFQRSLPFARMTALDNVLVAAYAFEDASLKNWPKRWLGIRNDESDLRARAMQLLELAGLAHVAHHISGELPYGDQRRLEIARALISNPKILMLDEPAAGLSREEAATIAKLLADLRREGQTVIIIEHNVPLIMSLCDRIVVLDHGLKIAEGVPAEIQSNQAVIAAYIGTRRRPHVSN